MENLGATMDAAVDRAVQSESNPGQDSAATATTPSRPASPDTASLPVSPASGSEDESGSLQPAAKDVEPTKQAPAEDEIVRDGNGWLTLEKRRTILSNARDKAATEERARLLTTLGVPEGANLDAVSRHVSLLVRNEVEYYQHLGRSLRARGLLSDEAPARSDPSQPTERRQAAAPSSFNLPEPTYRTADGAGIYSTDDMKTIVNTLIEHLNGVVDSRVEPHSKVITEVETERAWLKADREAVHDIEQAKKWPHFDKLGKRVGQLMRAAAQRGDNGYTLKNAYNEAYVEWDVSEAPIREQTTRERLAAELNQQPAADITSPAAPVVRPGRGPRSRDDMFTDAVDRAAKKHGM